MVIMDDNRSLDRENTLDVDISKLTGREGSAATMQFLKGLIERYPDSAYAPGVQDELNADRVTYVAKRHDAPIGVVDGIAHGQEFESHSFIIDPRYRGKGVAKVLDEAVHKDFAVSRIVAYPFGQPRSEGTARIEEHMAKLVAYYKTLGYEEDKDAPPSVDPGVPMIWRGPEQVPQLFDRIKALADEISTKIEKGFGEEAATNFFKDGLRFAQELARKHPDTFDLYASYHVLTHSSPPYEAVPGRRAVTRGDFPGEDSVEKFLENHRRQYNV